jgi:3'-phosphoadenosine 5'-phosphosulfate sulfotransferase (PAPS reductase)/FAD synthetase
MSMARRIHIVSVSGGKDSTATAILAIDRFPDDVRLVFADTGNEHEQTYDYIRDYLPTVLDRPIEWVRADFSLEIAIKRMFIARDCRTARKRGKRVRWTNKAKRRALDVLHPTGNPYLDLCLWKGRFPSRKAQFCTEELKAKPLIEYQYSLVRDGFKVWSWQGVRRDESRQRKFAKRIEHVIDGLYCFRPIVDWTARQTVDFVLSRGVRLNPLYSQGMNRVGCMPCINCSKAEISEIARRFPEHIERIAEWEGLVADASKRSAASFFPDPDRDAHLDKRGITKVVEWAHTSHGGRQFQMPLLERVGCSSSYGLCE